MCLLSCAYLLFVSGECRPRDQGQLKVAPDVPKLAFRRLKSAAPTVPSLLKSDAAPGWLVPNSALSTLKSAALTELSLFVSPAFCSPNSTCEPGNCVVPALARLREPFSCQL